LAFKKLVPELGNRAATLRVLKIPDVVVGGIDDSLAVGLQTSCAFLCCQAELIGDLKGFLAGLTKLNLNAVQLGSSVGLGFEKQPRAFAVFVSESRDTPGAGLEKG
jgi:hypothetical protein